MAQPRFRLAVLSDLHIDREVDRDSWKLAKAAFREAVAQGADHVVVVGDAFDCSTAMVQDQEKLRAFLAKEGLWHRDRLTIVVGNHDIFHTPHRGGRLHQAAEATQIALSDGQAMYDRFCAWAGELASPADRYFEDDLFPLSKDLGFVRLTGLDTTESTTLESSNASLSKSELPPPAAVADGKRHVLAIHNAPVKGRIGLKESIQGYAGGFSKKHLRRLAGFADEAKVETVVCGHIHDFGEDDVDYIWELEGGQPVYLMGRTGGVHDMTPAIGLLDIPERGKLRWSEVEV